jgi:predicted acyltransferase
MPFAFAVRLAKGEGWGRQFLHVVKRCSLLILIGVFLDSYAAGQWYFQLIRVLQQIAIGYFLAFFVLHLGTKVQALAAVLLLVGHTAAFMIYDQVTGSGPWSAEPLRASTPDPFRNVGTYIDWWLGLRLSTGNYVTFNAISSAATILFGVLTGELLRSSLSPGKKLVILTGAGLAGLATGWALAGGGFWLPVNWTAVVPMIKKLWTSSFAIYAAGWTCLMMATFYLLIDCTGWKWWSIPFVVVGVNSIFMYVIAGILTPVARRIADLLVQAGVGIGNWVRELVHGRAPADTVTPPLLDANWSALLAAFLSLFVLWLVCLWLYRRRIFLKV